MSKIQEKSNFTYDPYAILQVESRATLDQVKMAYKTLARIYHPDKGGHPEMFRMINEAYQTILKQYRNRPQTVKDLRKAREDLKVTQKGTVTKKNFNLEKFNAQFEQHRDPKQDYVYDIDHSNATTERTFSKYQQERQRVVQDLEKMKPIFNRGMGFNPNVFNRLFEQLKDSQVSSSDQPTGTNLLEQQFNQVGLVEAGQQSSNSQQVTLINPHQGLEKNTQPSVYQYHQMAREFQNPGELSAEQYDQYAHQPDVTRVSALSKSEAKRRMDEYRAQQYQIEKGAGPPPALDPATAYQYFQQQDYLQQDDPNYLSNLSAQHIHSHTHTQHAHTQQPVGFLEYPSSSQEQDQQMENTHPSLLASNHQPANGLLPMSYHYHPDDPNSFQEGKPTTPQTSCYDHLANIRDHFQMMSPGRDDQGYLENSGYPNTQMQQQRPQFSPKDFYEEVVEGQMVEGHELVEDQMIEGQMIEGEMGEGPTDSSNQNQFMNDMAEELTRMKQKMAMQDRLLRKMHRRNKELNSQIYKKNN